jgi:hypothetical protein
MSRPRGGYIGFNRVPAATAINSAASGVWTLREAEALRRAGTWPTLAPGGVGSGLQLWLDASDASTLYDATTGGSLVAADGGVARWEDKSGNARHATQSTQANRPVRKTSQQNGLDTILFDGSNDSLSISGSNSSLKFLHSTQNTVFIVVRCGTSANPNYRGAIFDSTDDLSTSGPGVTLHYDDRASQSRNDLLNFDLWNAIAAPDPYVGLEASNNRLTANTYLALSLEIDPTTGTAANRIRHRVNGSAAVGGNTFTGTLSTANSKGSFTMGAAGNGTSPFSGNLAELIIYNAALSGTDRERVEDYLIDKWGIT